MTIPDCQFCAHMRLVFEGFEQTLKSTSKHVFAHRVCKWKGLIRGNMPIRKSGFPHKVIHRLSTSNPAFHATYPQGYPQTRLQYSKVKDTLVTTTEKTKRPSAVTRRPLLIHPLATTNGGTVPESTDGRTTAAVNHLNLLRSDPGNAPYFVRLAYVYGLTIPRIVQESSLPVDAVQRMVLGGDR